MADALTLPELLAELARHNLRVASVTMAGGSVASFAAVPAEVDTAERRVTVRPVNEAEVEEEPEPGDVALETFVNRKGLKK